MGHAGFHIYTGVPATSTSVDLQAGQTFTIADAFGTRSGSAPNATAAYLGAMVGTLTQDQYSGDVLVGDAELVYDANDGSVDLDFTEIVNVDDANHTPDAISFAALNLAYDETGQRIASTVEGNESALSARFYGDTHQEVAGIFNHMGVIGSFGGRRTSAEFAELRRFERDVASLLADSNSGFNNMRAGLETRIAPHIVPGISGNQTIMVQQCGFDGGDSNLLTCRFTANPTAPNTFIELGNLAADLRGESVPRQLREVGGISLTHVSAAGDSSVRRFGGWMSHAGFHLYTDVPARVFSGLELLLPGNPTFAIADAFGSESGSAPGATAIYAGAMVGTPADHEQDTHGEMLVGDAELSFDANDNSVDLDFTNITNVDQSDAQHTPASISFAALNLEYDATSRRIASTVDGNEMALSARFYGPNHEEVAGVFNHMGVIGSFGGRRGSPGFLELRRFERAIAGFTSVRSPLFAPNSVRLQNGSSLAIAISAFDCRFGDGNALDCDSLVQLVLRADLRSIPLRQRLGAPLLVHNGVNLTGVQGVGEYSGVRRYGGWMAHAGFHIYTGVPLSAPRLPSAEAGQTFAIADVFGTASGRAANATAIYLGAMVGAPVNNPGEVLVGDAELTFDADDNGVDLDFTNITNVDGSAGPISSISFADLDLVYDLVSRSIGRRVTPIGGGTALSAQFYGDNHEEVAGSFNHMNVVGSFGAQRAPAGFVELRRFERAIAGFPSARSPLVVPDSVELQDGTSLSIPAFDFECTFGDANALDCTSSGGLGLRADLRDIPLQQHLGTELLVQNGINLTGVQGVEDNSGVRRYGGWMTHAGFHIYTGVPVTSNSRNLAAGQTFAIADTFGSLTSSSSSGDPSASIAPDADATWQGAMVGTPTQGENSGDILVGDARLDFVLGGGGDTSGGGSLTATFSNILNVDDGEDHSDTTITVAGTLRSRGFIVSGGSGYIGGGLFGPNGEEIAGTFNHMSVLGAFGAQLQEPEGPTGPTPEELMAAQAELTRAQAAFTRLSNADSIDNTRDVAEYEAYISPERVRYSGGLSTADFTDDAGIAECGNDQANFDILKCDIAGDAIDLVADLRGGMPTRALLVQNRIDLTDVRGAGGNSNVRRFGGWMEHAGFYLYTGVTAVRTDPTATALQAGQTFVISDHLGRGSDDSPDSSGTYLGAMVGTPVAGQDFHGNVLVGDAELTYDSDTDGVTLAFSNIFNVDEGEAHTVTDISFADLDYEADGNQIYDRDPDGTNDYIAESWFYGPNAEEVAGFFNRENITGVFGVRRVSAEFLELLRAEEAINALIADENFANARTPAVLYPGNVRTGDGLEPPFTSRTCSFGANANEFSCALLDISGVAYSLTADLSANGGDPVVAQVQNNNDVFVTRQSGTGDNSDVHRYGAWMDHAGFYVYPDVPITTEAPSGVAAGQTYFIADYFGSDEASRPSGDATFRGAMVGTPRIRTPNHGDVLVGDALIIYTTAFGGPFGLANLSIDFSNIVNLSQNGAMYGDGTLSLEGVAPSANRDGSLEGGFQSADFTGQFYGPAGSEEIVGDFSSTALAIEGVFGAKRVQE